MDELQFRGKVGLSLTGVVRMKKLGLAAVLGLVLAAPAMAQSQGASAWYVTSANEDGTTTMDVGRLEKRGDVVVGMASLYFVNSKTTKEGEAVDFIQTLDAYDCSHPNSSRTLMAEGYRVGKQPPVFAYDDTKTAQWRTYNEGTPGAKAWEAACKGPNPGLKLPAVETHEQVLEMVREHAAEYARRQGR